MRLTFLGTGTSTGVPTLACQCPTCQSSDVHDQRTRSSVLLEFAGRAVVIDTTPDFRQQALRERLNHLDAVLFTHTHADHVFGLDDVRVYNLRQKHAIPIYADDRSMQDIRRIYNYVFAASYPAGGLPNFDPHLIDGPFDLWGEKIIPLPVFHGNLPILGFRFGRTAYVTDFSTIPGTTMGLLSGLDVLILDALRHNPHPTHSTLENSISLVKQLKPQRAFFTHIAHELQHAATNAALAANMWLAHDGLKLDV
jgi:phosphoribosyl 1,2-cyclic phosphate phosphodiesterase